MKVAIGFIPIASGPWMLKQGFAVLGVDATTVVMAPHQFGYPYDMEVKTPQDIAKVLSGHDVFISMFGNSIVGDDIGYWQSLGKKFITVFNGCDVRTPKLVAETKQPAVCIYCDYLAHCDHDSKFKNMTWCLENSDAVFCDLGVMKCVEPEASRLGKRLYPYYQPYHMGWLKSPAPPEKIKVFNMKNPMKIIHAPSDKSKKGTPFIIAAVEELTLAGCPIALKIIQGSHTQVKGAMQISDLAIDQVMIGWYGTFTVEAIAAGCPTLCFVDKASNYVPPGMVITRDSIGRGIKYFVDNPERLNDLLTEQRAVILPQHEAANIARDMLNSITKQPILI